MGEHRDRGNIKWTAMMLPEHVEQLRIWKNEEEIDKKPIDDSYRLEYFEEQLRLAIHQQQALAIEYWEKGKRITASGRIESYTVNPQRIMLLQIDGHMRNIDLATIYTMSIEGHED